MQAISQVPQHTILTLDDGISEKIQIAIKLPGVNSALEFTVKIQDGHLNLDVPGRYKLTLPLEYEVEEKPEELKFVKSRSELKAVLRVVGKVPAKPEHVSASVPASNTAPEADKLPKLAVHDSFAVDAAKLLTSKRRSRPSSAKMKPAQTTQNVAPESDHISNKDFEEYERPKRRNRALDKLSLSGFVKSSGREKAKKTGINQEPENNDDDDLSDLESVMEQLLPGSSEHVWQSSRRQQEVQAVLSEPVHQSFHRPLLDTDQESSSLDSHQFGELPQHLEVNVARLSDLTAPGGLDEFQDLASHDVHNVAGQATNNVEIDQERSGMEERDSRLGNIRGIRKLGNAADDAKLPRPALSSRSLAEPEGPSAPRTPRQSSGGNDCIGKSRSTSPNPRNSDKTLGTSVHFETNSSPKTQPKKIQPEKDHRYQLNPANSAQVTDRATLQSPVEATSTEQHVKEKKTSPEPSPRRAIGTDCRSDSRLERGHEPRSDAAPTAIPCAQGISQERPNGPAKKKAAGKHLPKNQAKNQQKQEEKPADHIPAFHPPPIPNVQGSHGYTSELPKGVTPEMSAIVKQWSRISDNFYAKFLPAGRFRDRLTMITVVLIALLVFVVAKITSWSLYLMRNSTNVIPSMLRRNGFHRGEKFLNTHRKNSRLFSLVLGALTIGTELCTIYYGITLALWLSWGSLCLAYELFWWSLSLLTSILWRPRLIFSLPASLYMRYGYHVTGPTKFAQFCILFWGVPMMIWGVHGGLLGVCVIPICILATLWDLGQFELVCIATASHLVGHWVIPEWIRIASLPLMAVYLFFSGSFVSTPDKPVQDLPEGAEGEILRVLQAQDFYEVMELSSSFDAEELRKSKRKLSLATHPDKHRDAPGANEAFARVTEAHDVLCDAKRRVAYDRELQCKALLEEVENRTDDTAGFSPRSLQFACSTCGLSHKGILTDRSVEKARYCAACKDYHPAEDGDGWRESSGFFWREAKVYVCLEGKILDMSDWVNCSLGTGNGLKGNTLCDTHEPLFRYRPNERKGAAQSGSHSKKKAKQRGRRR